MIKLLKKLFASSKTTASHTDKSSPQEGTIKFFNYRKGFGFITFKNSDEEIFVHKSNLKTKIKQGNTVTFEIGKSDQGPTAINVKRIGKPKKAKAQSK